MTEEPIKKGWECVKCGRVYAPWMVRCPVCTREKRAYPTSEEIKKAHIKEREQMEKAKFKRGD